MRGLAGLFHRRNRLAAAHIELGAAGEFLAEKFLRSVGYRIVVTNYAVPLGRGVRGHPLSGEIDIIAYEGKTLCFIEVKTRSGDEIASPERAVTLNKQRQIARAARRYREYMQVVREPYRFDVIGIIQRDGQPPEISLTKNFFRDPTRSKRKFSNAR